MLWSIFAIRDIERRKYGIYKFRIRFAELVGIETAAETNPGVRVLQRQQLSAEFIDLTDVNTQNGVAYLVSIGLLTQERGAEILDIGIEPTP